jgi:hypothetical protein
MPKHESEPIREDEWLLRRVRRERFRPLQIPLIAPAAFEPRIKGRDPDLDGISLFREPCLNGIDDLVATMLPEKRHLEGIVRFPVAAIRAMGLTIDSKPISSVAGHVVLREVNSAAFAAREDWLPAVLDDLATIASEPVNILIWPDTA